MTAALLCEPSEFGVYPDPVGASLRYLFPSLLRRLTCDAA